MNLHPGVKLGKRRPRYSAKTAHMIDFIDRLLLPAPSLARDWNEKLPADLGMMKNDVWGDCGFAAQGHAVQTWTSDTGTPFTPTDDQVQAAYSGCTSFDPSKPETDNGVVLLDALNYWRTVGIGGHKIGAFMKVDHHNIDHVKIGIDLFGGIYTGWDLPIIAQSQVIWTGGTTGSLTGDSLPGTWGGHATWTPTFDHDYFTTITWGARKQGDWQYHLDYCDEAFVCVSLDWVNGTSPAPNGFNLMKLQTYLSRL